MASKTSKIYQAVKANADTVLNGRLLAIDPSTGSRSSMPGFAVFKQGQLIESGIIQIKYDQAQNIRLHRIVETLRNEFQKPDIIAFENIPPVSFKGGIGMNSNAVTSLQRAVGAIISCWDCPAVPVATSAWKGYKGEDYKKSDEWDSICIGRCVIGIAKDIKKEEQER